MASVETPITRAEREVLLTLTDRQYDEMGTNVEQIKRELGIDSTTQVMIEAIRRLAHTPDVE